MNYLIKSPYFSKLKISLLGILILSIASCKDVNNPYFDEVLKSQQGELRGITIGANIDEVKTQENSAFLKDEMPDYLFYDYELDMGNSYTVAYDFYNQSLYEIEVEVYFDLIEDASTLLKSFKNHFENKYGEEKIEKDGYYTWKTRALSTKHRIKISIINNSESFGYVKLLVRDLDY